MRSRCACYYDEGAPTDWQERFVTAYAAAHPWEDWAETWAQYLHMVDTLETAAACGALVDTATPGRALGARDSAAGIAAAGCVRSPDRQLVSVDYVMNN